MYTSDLSTDYKGKNSMGRAARKAALHAYRSDMIRKDEIPLFTPGLSIKRINL